MICLRCGHYTDPDREMDRVQGSEHCTCPCHPWNAVPEADESDDVPTAADLDFLDDRYPRMP